MDRPFRNRPVRNELTCSKSSNFILSLNDTLLDIVLQGFSHSFMYIQSKYYHNILSEYLTSTQKMNRLCLSKKATTLQIECRFPSM